MTEMPRHWNTQPFFHRKSARRRGKFLRVLAIMDLQTLLRGINLSNINYLMAEGEGFEPGLTSDITCHLTTLRD